MYTTAPIAKVTFILSAILLLFYVIDVNFTTISSNILTPLVRQQCDCESVSRENLICPTNVTCSGDKPVKEVDLNKTTFKIPRQEWYNELLAERVGTKWRCQYNHIRDTLSLTQLVKGSQRMNISLVAAYEYPEQLNIVISSRNKFGDIVYCRYFDKYKQELGQAFRSVVFPEFNVHCLRRNGAKFMSLTDTPTAEYEFPVPIIDRTQNEVEHFFSVCVAPIYGKEPKWILLAEFIEHYKLQGATHFYVYSKYIDEYSRILLDDYVRTGDAEAIILHDRFERADDRWQAVELQAIIAFIFPPLLLLTSYSSAGMAAS
ncbi:hypothetical protein NECAME_07944 [Necator americanus]|uniref:Glycosyltransferase family 92 protein n=1 Tax=Necator americanus TaxID=51031 RepID=W2TL30_NECAM|nr:hypothetical protein NECAME_07944 [Necator americanus]ETN82498.1 hypothetical protein NECAME_07944 [Necator americanus]